MQKEIIEEFAKRFVPNSGCLYVGDTTEKDLVKNIEKLAELGIDITHHDKMPDGVLYREDRNRDSFCRVCDFSRSDESEAGIENNRDDAGSYNK